MAPHFVQPDIQAFLPERKNNTMLPLPLRGRKKILKILQALLMSPATHTFLNFTYKYHALANQYEANISIRYFEVFLLSHKNIIILFLQTTDSFHSFIKSCGCWKLLQKHVLSDKHVGNIKHGNIYSTTYINKH